MEWIYKKLGWGETTWTLHALRTYATHKFMVDILAPGQLWWVYHRGGTFYLKKSQNWLYRYCFDSLIREVGARASCFKRPNLLLFVLCRFNAGQCEHEILAFYM